MRLSPIHSLLIAGALAGCKTVNQAAQAPEAPAPSVMAQEDEHAEKADAREALEHKVHLAAERLALQEREMHESNKQFEDRIRFANVEVDMAQAKLDVFRESVRPERLANESLSLASAKDRAQQAADELAQIEIMYKDQDLDDLTAEFVVSRGRRNAERAAQRIGIMEIGFARLENHELPQEEQGLSLDVEKAASALHRLHSDREIDHKRKKLALEEARFALHKLAQELHEHAHDDDHDHDHEDGHEHEHGESEEHEDHQ
ncbi:MAG: hypothetical protein QF404_13455 [Planctomycetota bacterium]|nr:hypothetical protein [Planctomycetota bacterium]